MRGVVVTSCLLLCFLGEVAGGAMLPAQDAKAPSDAQSGSDPALARLLDEVHQLRLALERSAVANTRFQMAVERMRIQQGHVDSIQKELSDIHSEISGLENSKEGLAERIHDAEGRMDQLTGTEHDELDGELRRAKQGMASIDRDLQARHGRESELTTRLADEERKLQELDRQLDALTEDLKRELPLAR